MRLCHCGNAVFGTDKNTKKGYCKSHQHQRTDLDKRSILEKGLDKARKKTVLVEDESWANLRDELDYVFSLYIRTKYANGDGIVECYTCDKKLPIKEITNGHCISRSEMGARFLIENCRPQCSYCNALHETKPEIFRNKSEQERKGTLEFLDDISHSVNKLTVSDLKEMLLDFRTRLSISQTKLKT